MLIANETQLNYISKVILEEPWTLPFIQELAADVSFDRFCEITDELSGIDEDLENDICITELDSVTLTEILENI